VFQLHISAETPIYKGEIKVYCVKKLRRQEKMDGVYEKIAGKPVKIRCQYEKTVGKHENMRERHVKMLGKHVKMRGRRDFSGFHRIQRIFLLNTTKLLI